MGRIGLFIIYFSQNKLDEISQPLWTFRERGGKVTATPHFTLKEQTFTMYHLSVKHGEAWEAQGFLHVYGTIWMESGVKVYGIDLVVPYKMNRSYAVRTNETSALMSQYYIR